MVEGIEAFPTLGRGGGTTCAAETRSSASRRSVSTLRGDLEETSIGESHSSSPVRSIA